MATEAKCPFSTMPGSRTTGGVGAEKSGMLAIPWGRRQRGKGLRLRAVRFRTLESWKRAVELFAGGLRMM